MSKKKSILRLVIPTAICSFMFVPLLSGVVSPTSIKEAHATASNVVWEGEEPYAQINSSDLPEENPMEVLIEFTESDAATIYNSEDDVIKEVQKSNPGVATFTNEEWASIKNDSYIKIWPVNGSSITKVSYIIAPDHTHGTGSDALGFYNWDGGAEHNAMPSEAGSYVLSSDIELTASWAVPSGTTNLCLNGHNIIMTEKDLNVIAVGAESILNLYDCGNTSHNGYVDSNGLWHLGEGEGTAKTLTGGIITGGYFTKTSGSGGGVNVGKGEFNMYGGTIAGNRAGANGGGVHIGSGGKFTMSGGEIIFNKASGGGGVSNQSGAFEISNGVITDNNATNGGGMFSFSGSTTITGGSICNNQATANGGGIYEYGTSCVFGGTAQITGNTLSGSSNNVFLAKGKTITLGTDENVPTTMSVGINTQIEPTKANPVKITADGSANYSANFFSDSIYYKPCFNNNGTADVTTDDYLELRTAYLIASDTKEDQKATKNGYIELPASAVVGDEVSVTVFPNEGYKLASLKYNDGEKDNDIIDLTFVMPDGEVSVTATFEEKGAQIITFGTIYHLYNGCSILITEWYKGAPNNYFKRLGEGEATIEYKVAGEDDSTYTTEAPKDPGNYVVRVSVAEDANYLAGSATKEFEIIEKVVIQKVAFNDIKQPEAGTTAQTEVTGMPFGANYSGTLSWSTPIPESGKYECGVTYTATVTLSLNAVGGGLFEFADDVKVVKPSLDTSGWELSDESTSTELIFTKTFETTAAHAMTHHDAVAPTCTENGTVEYWSCSRETGVYYGDAQGTTILDTIVDPKLAHDMNYHEAVSPTCTEDGTIAYWACSHEPGVYYANEDRTETLENIVASKVGHDPIHHDGKEATCTQAGNVEYWSCSECGKNYSDEACTQELETVVINPHAHSMTHHDAVEATCTENGSVEYWSCSECGKNYADEAGAEVLESIVDQAKGHSMTHHDAVEATCEQAGNVEYWSCSECKKNFADEAGTNELNSVTVAKLGHAIQHHDAKAATCTEAGWEAYDTCSRCDYSTYVEIPALGHEASSLVEGLDPTHENDGYKPAYKCSVCGEYFEDQAQTKLIGDETAYNAWKANAGRLEKLVKEETGESSKDNTGLIVGLSLGLFFLLLLIIYLIVYFFWYRKGKLDDKKIKVIYKILPRGKKNLPEEEQGKNEASKQAKTNNEKH